MMTIWHKTRAVKLHERPIEEGMLEEQHLPRLLVWPLAFVGAGAVYGVLPDSTDYNATQARVWWLIGTAVLVGLLLSLRLLIEVKEGYLTVGFRPFYRRCIPLAEISRCQSFTFVPPGNEMRYTPMVATLSSVLQEPQTQSVFRVPETHGVQLTMTDGHTWRVSTAHPARLIHAIEHAKARSAAS